METKMRFQLWVIDKRYHIMIGFVICDLVHEIIKLELVG